MEKSPEVTWPAEWNELRTIEELLHCKICYEYIDTSVVTPCSHNYCSICIRKFLHYKTQCPTCYVNLYEKDLHPNRIVDEILASYLTLRAKLVARIIETSENKSHNHQTNKSPTLSVTPTIKIKEEPDSRPQISTPKTASQPGFRIARTPRSTLGTPSTSDRTPRINNLFGAKSIEKKKPETSVKKVPCPVCGIDISETNINRHLDDCLKRQRSTSSPKTVENNLQPIPKYVTNLMKDGELRKVLKKYGLSTLGARKILEKRLQRFSVLYNAERDKLAPKSMLDLVKQCKDEEIAEKNLTNKLNSSDYGQVIDRKTDASVIEKVQKQYIEKNKDSYKKLIESIKLQKKLKNNPAKSLFKDIDDETVATTSSSNSVRTLHSTGEVANTSEEDTSKYLPSDTDSSAPCPLLHYSNVDPMRYLSLEMSSDSQNSPTKKKCDINSGTSFGSSRDSIGKIVSPDPSPRGVLAAVGNGNLPALRVNVAALMPQNDIFDASTEDNWSDSTRDKNLNNRAKRSNRKTRVKQSKKTKRRSGNLSSSDSETDVEIRSTKIHSGIQKPRGDKVSEIGYTAGQNNNGNLSPESTTHDRFEILVAGPKVDKENIEALPRAAAGGETSARRSSRTRNTVHYSYNSRTGLRSNENKNKAEQVLEEHQPVNFIDLNETRDRKSGEENEPTKRPLRKRRKTVKQ